MLLSWNNNVNNGFYLLTAYHLNKEYGLKALEKKMKKRLQTPL